MRFNHLLALGMLAAGVGLAIAEPAYAQSGFSLVPECARSSALTPPDLDCALITFRGISFFLFGISGSVALLFFIYGGFLTLVSGFSDQVKKGKELIRNAVIGLFIIMTAAYGVDYFVGRLTNNEVRTIGSPCGTSGVWGYVDNEIKCVTKCEDLSGYQCTSTFDFGNCVDLIKSCGQDRKCCAPASAP